MIFWKISDFVALPRKYSSLQLVISQVRTSATGRGQIYDNISSSAQCLNNYKLANIKAVDRIHSKWDQSIR